MRLNSWLANRSALQAPVQSMAYRIKTVSEITGIPRNTLIAWERRYGAVRPQRHDNGYRSYSESDVAQLLRIKNALKAGLKISEAVALIEEHHDLPEARGPASDERRNLPSSDDDAFLAIRDQLLDALVDYRKEDAERLLARLMTVPFGARLHEVYFPILSRIGDLWEAGEISVAQEHYASAILRSHFASILVSIGPGSPHAPHAACTTYPGEMHEMAALALAIQLSLGGHRVSYLGANLPVEGLRSFYQKEKPKILCVSVITPTTAESVRAYVEQLAPHLDASSRLILGGRGISGIDVARVPGVQLVPNWADLET